MGKPMRHGSSNRRRNNRGGGSRKNNNNQKTQVFDSNGPDVRIRGTAHQVAEKYEALAKDAASSGDRILAESYLQHAEHYQRIINESNVESGSKQRQGDSGRNKNQKREQKPAAKEDDLALPASILGEEPKAEAAEGEKERTGELSDA